MRRVESVKSRGMHAWGLTDASRTPEMHAALPPGVLLSLYTQTKRTRESCAILHVWVCDSAPRLMKRISCGYEGIMCDLTIVLETTPMIPLEQRVQCK